MNTKIKNKIGVAILVISAMVASAIFSSALAYTPLLGTSAGGTGTSTTPVAGGVVVGNGTTYGILPTSTNGTVLTQSSTAPLGVAWQTAAAGGGSVSTDTPITVGYGPKWDTAGGALSGTSSIFYFNDGDVSIGTTTDCGLICIVNASGTITYQVLTPTGTLPLLGVTSSGIPLFLGTSTAVAIGGASLALDACTSTTTIVPFALNTSTDIAAKTTPIVPLNDSIFDWNSWISQTGAVTSTVTTQVCTALAAGATPTSTKYLFDIERVSGM